MSYYPVSLNLDGRQCVVIGGGRVAERKVQGLLACGGRVTVISPELTAGLLALYQDRLLAWEARLYREGDLAEVFLAIAATDDGDVQRRIHAEAEGRQVLLNVADVPQYCSFILPATVRRGELTIAVSTGGRSPALARNLRLELEKKFGSEYKILVDILGVLRQAVLADGRPQAENEALFNGLDHQTMLAFIRQGNWDGLAAHVRAVLGDGIGAGVWPTIRDIFASSASGAGRPAE
ncbi:MAG: hypothetical protein A2521_13830 [Deltaproteobacteria bacterium RIFOXYD12_FULL_57_12]|nr:MAG: hypothetical protein A2521_13830 [Deltaproteobacteria bacterium RIFOXYD12_FULL_57_12]